MNRPQSSSQGDKRTPFPLASSPAQRSSNPPTSQAADTEETVTLGTCAVPPPSPCNQSDPEGPPLPLEKCDFSERLPAGAVRLLTMVSWPWGVRDSCGAVSLLLPRSSALLYRSCSEPRGRVCSGVPPELRSLKGSCSVPLQLANARFA